MIAFVEHLLIITTSNYSAVYISHTLHYTVACTKTSQSAVLTNVSQFTNYSPHCRVKTCRLVAICHQPPTLNF
jgi:hypothetical protein